MDRFVLWWGLSLALCIPDVGTGQNLRRLYDDSLLLRLQAIYTPNLRWNLESLLVTRLTGPERQRLAGVQLVTPLRDANADPLSYLSYRDPAPTVSVSVFSIKFFDDLAVANSWLEAHGYSAETTIDYLGVLKYRRAADFAEGRYPRPFPTLGIPPDAARDPTGGEVADKILKSAIVFVVAHELGHLNQAGGGASDIAQAQANEAAADAFAIEMFRRIGLAPLGIVYLFQLPVYLGKNRGDFTSDDAWNNYQRSEATHPLSGARLQHLGRELQRSSDDFLKYESDSVAGRARIAMAAQELTKLGRLFDDPDLQRWHRLRGEQIPLAELRPRRPGNPWIPQ